MKKVDHVLAHLNKKKKRKQTYIKEEAKTGKKPSVKEAVKYLYKFTFLTK